MTSLINQYFVSGPSYDNENPHKALGKVMGLMFLGGTIATAIGGAHLLIHLCQSKKLMITEALILHRSLV